MKIKNSWKDHPWNKGELVGEADVNFLKQISNPKSDEYTNLPNGKLVHQDKVWDNIIENGMFEPLLITISVKNKKIRLESGNHRINTAIKNEVSTLPCAVFVFENNVLYEQNGKHNFDASNIVDFEDMAFIKCPYPYQVDTKVLIAD